MKRFVAVLTVLGFLWSISPSAGDPPAHLDLVRGLREQQMADYALQYLQKLSENPPPELALVLPLELAKTRMEVAQMEANEGRKLGLYARARAELQAFVDKNPKHPLALEANLDVARLAALQGKGQLGKARRQENPDTEKAELLKARVQFQDAGNQLKAAADRIDAQLKTLAAPKAPEQYKSKQDLTQAKLRAELDQAINLLDQAQTFHEGEALVELKKRGELVQQAIKRLEKLSKTDDKNLLCWEARAWLGRAHQENDDPPTARKVYAEIINEEGDQAKTANRLARYFRMLVLRDDKNEKDPLGRIQASAEQWLDRYADYADTPEGYGVRFQLGKVYYDQARKLPKPQQLGLKGKDLLTKAQRQFQLLERTRNDFSEQARRLRAEIILETSDHVAKGPVEKLKNFEECFLRAQVEAAQMHKLAKSDTPAEKRDEQRKQHFQTLIEALHRGLELADAKVPADDQADARYLLTYAYLASGDPYRAAIVGEELARAEPKAARASQAGAYALFAYGQVVNLEQQAAGADPEPHRQRLRKLAHYIEQTWPDDPAADDARYQLALLLLQAKKHAEAVEVLERVTPAYHDATRAQYQLAMAAFSAHREEAKPPAGKPSYEERGIRALKAIPELTSGADPTTVEIYLLARLELSRVYYAEKKFAEMQALLDKLAKVLDEACGLDKEAKESLEATVKGRRLLAQYGVGEEQYAAGAYTKVRETLAPVVKQLDNPDKIKAAAAGNDPRFVYALLGLALRANIQDNRLDQAKNLLALLQKGDPDQARQVHVQTAHQLGKQIQDLRGQEGEDAKKKLEALTANFTTFLAEVGKQAQADPEMAFFLAQGYSTLDKHQEVAELLAKVPEPPPRKLVEPQPPAEPKDPNDKVAAEAHKKLLEAHEKELAVYKKEADAYRREVQIYRASRILLVRSLRLSKDYKKAQAEADAVLKQPWAKSNMDLQKERVFILEDQGSYGGKGGAVIAWYGLMDNMKNELNNPKVKEAYFECYFHYTRGLYLNAQKIPDAKKKAAGVRSAAQSIANLRRALDDRKAADAKAGKPDPEVEKVEEAAWKRMEAYLEKEPELKAVYEELRKAS